MHDLSVNYSITIILPKSQSIKITSIQFKTVERQRKKDFLENIKERRSLRKSAQAQTQLLRKVILNKYALGHINIPHPRHQHIL